VEVTVERGSVQHGARLDDELAAGSDALTAGATVSARERADLDPEAPTVDELDLSATRPDLDGGTPVWVTARSELARWLLPSSFPADATVLLEGAEDLGAPDEVLLLLGSLEPLTRYETVGEVWIALGGAHETRAGVERPEDAPDAASVSDDRRDQHGEARTEPTVAPAPEPAPDSGRPALPDAEADGSSLVGTVIQLALVPARIGLTVGREALQLGRRVLGGR
jgi:hypothetical protein